MATQYAIGYRFECRVRDYFRDMGHTVIRSAGSKTGTDLVIFDQDFILMIQCTTNEESKKDKDREKLAKMAVNPNTIPVMAWKEKYRGPIVFERLDGGPIFWEDEDEV